MNPSNRETETVFHSDEIDLFDLIRDLWGHRNAILILIVSGALVSLAYAWTRPKTFTSSVLLVPTESGSMSQLGAAASLLGKKGSGMADVDLYQSLLVSRTVLNGLLRSSIPNPTDTGKGRKEILATILKVDTANPIKLDRMLSALPYMIEVAPDKQGSSGMIEVRVTASQPWLAQAIANELVSFGQEELRRVRAHRSDAILERLSAAIRNQTEEWDSASKRLFDFRSSNRSIASPAQQREEERLQLELQSKQQSLLLARSQYQQQLLDREKAAPPMVVLDPANLPAVKSGPKRLLILVIGTFLASLGALGYFVVGWLLRTSSRTRRD